MRLRFLRKRVALFLLLLMPAASAYGQEKVHISIAPSVTGDLSVGQQKFINDEFPLLVKDFTGLPGQLEKVGSTKELAEKLHAGKSQFGVFQGIEFAETQAANPNLQPLLLAVYRTPVIKALLVSKKEAPYSAFADLRGKDVAVLKAGKEHIRRFAHKEAGGDPEKFFSKVITPANAEAALDAVLLGKAQAAIVDNASLDIYREVNPGRFQRLKVVNESAPFPPAVIAYDPKQIDAAIVKRFQNGMMKANESAKGREVMSSFRITSFTPIPTGFDKTLAEIRKAYPE